MKLLKILKNGLENLKHKKIRITHRIMVNLLIIRYIIIVPNILIQVQVTIKMILMKNQDINMENQ